MTPADDLPALPQFPTLIDCLIVANTAHARARKQLEDYVRAYALAARAERDAEIERLKKFISNKAAKSYYECWKEADLRAETAEARVKELEDLLASYKWTRDNLRAQIDAIRNACECPHPYKPEEMAIECFEAGRCGCVYGQAPDLSE